MTGQDPRTGLPRPDAVPAPGGSRPSALPRTVAGPGAPAEFGRDAGFRMAVGLAVRGPRRIAGFWREALLVIVVTVLLTAGVKSFVVETFRIPSGSMENTLRIGDRVLVNKLVYRIRGIDRGDVVVFSGAGSWGPTPPPQKAGSISAAYRDALQALGLETDGTDYVKRVIGLPGDHVACCTAQGRITVNGVPLREGSYLYPGEAPSAEFFNITVRPGRLWVMGDHRGESSDSRYHSADPGGGTIPESAVVGRAFVVIWPPSQVKSLPIPATFTSRATAAAPAPMIPATMEFSGAPLAWAWRHVPGRLPAGRR
jgi:signal peptidase I